LEKKTAKEQSEAEIASLKKASAELAANAKRKIDSLKKQVRIKFNVPKDSLNPHAENPRQVEEAKTKFLTRMNAFADMKNNNASLEALKAAHQKEVDSQLCVKPEVLLTLICFSGFRFSDAIEQEIPRYAK
jgi:hypothetical protein